MLLIWFDKWWWPFGFTKGFNELKANKTICAHFYSCLGEYECKQADQKGRFRFFPYCAFFSRLISVFVYEAMLNEAVILNRSKIAQLYGSPNSDMWIYFFVCSWVRGVEWIDRLLKCINTFCNIPNWIGAVQKTHAKVEVATASVWATSSCIENNFTESQVELKSQF